MHDIQFDCAVSPRGRNLGKFGSVGSSMPTDSVRRIGIVGITRIDIRRPIRVSRVGSWENIAEIKPLRENTVSTTSAIAQVWCDDVELCRVTGKVL